MRAAIAAVLALLVVNSSSISRKPRLALYGQCYDFQTPATLDLKQFAEGPWYEIQRYNNVFQEDSRCAIQVYFLNEAENIIDISLQFQDTNGLTTFFKGKVNFNKTESELQLEVDYNEGIYSSFDVVSTDPTKYAIIYSCLQTSYDPYLPEKQERMWVLGRTPTLDNATMQTVNAALQVNGTDFGDYLELVHHENCSYTTKKPH